MEITYLGHSSFKIKGASGTIVTDPFTSKVGFSFPQVSADVVTVSHDHFDHNAFSLVKPTSRRERPFIIDTPGEYEVGGISVFGVSSFHDNENGAKRGMNNIFTILVDGMRVCHLGDLGHELSASKINEIGSVDVLLCPVGGEFTLGPSEAIKVIQSIEPSIVIPMHFKTTEHDGQAFAELKTVEEFVKEYGQEAVPTAKLTLELTRLPEETELNVLVKS